MRLNGALIIVGFLGTAVMAHASSFVIDNFSCSDSVSLTGLGSTFGMVSSCPGSIGGSRSDLIAVSGGSGDSVSTIDSNPPTGAITGSFGSGLSGSDILTWFGSTTPGVLDLPNLDLSGDSILVPIKSGSGGTLTVYLKSGSTNSSNRLAYSVTFSASSSFVDELIPLTDPTILGTGANVDDVTGIGLDVTMPT
jgi:hypothetical protein